MLGLLTLHDANLLILHWQRKIDNPFIPETIISLGNIVDGSLKLDYFMNVTFLKNVIAAGELPAIKKPKGKAFEKRIHDEVGVPEEYREHLPKQYDYWINYSDLIIFIERPDKIDSKNYTHSRESLAKVAWMLTKNNSSMENNADLFEYLSQLATDLDGDGIKVKLGDTTLKSCVREIIAAGAAIEEKT